MGGSVARAAAGMIAKDLDMGVSDLDSGTLDSCDLDSGDP